MQYTHTHTHITSVLNFSNCSRCKEFLQASCFPIYKQKFQLWYLYWQINSSECYKSIIKVSIHYFLPQKMVGEAIYYTIIFVFVCRCTCACVCVVCSSLITCSDSKIPAPFYFKCAKTKNLLISWETSLSMNPSHFLLLQGTERMKLFIRTPIAKHFFLQICYPAKYTIYHTILTQHM